MTKWPDSVDPAKLVSEGRLRQQRPDPEALLAAIEAARHDIEAADAMRETSPSWSETMLYEAGLRCSRAIVHAAGFRIAAEWGHVTAITAADALTDGAHHRIFVRLNRMRRTRHEFMYEVGREPSSDDLAQSRRDIVKLVEIATASIRGKDPG